MARKSRFATSPRPPGRLVDTVVLHATATASLAEALEILRARGLSYHALVDRDGRVIRLVPWERMAFHAGESFGPQGDQVNEYSVGLSFVNLNDGLDPFTVAQEASVRALIEEVARSSPLRHLTTHRAIAPHRKNDPLGYDAKGLAADRRLILWGDDY